MAITKKYHFYFAGPPEIIVVTSESDEELEEGELEFVPSK